MERFDAIVVGAGSGLTIADRVSSSGHSVALVEQGPMGGTCLNRGCIPSKMLIHSGDVAETVKSSAKFGVKASVSSVSFGRITGRVSKIVDEDSRDIEEGISEDKNVALFKSQGRFVGKRKMKVGLSLISGDRVFIWPALDRWSRQYPGLKNLDF